MRIASLARLALIVAVIVAAGCSGNKGKIENSTWASKSATINGTSLPPAALLLQFGSDGHVVYTVVGKQFKGHYALGMGPAIIFTFEEDLDGRKIHPCKLVVDGDQLTLTGADGSELTFVNVKMPHLLG